MCGCPAVYHRLGSTELLPGLFEGLEVMLVASNLAEMVSAIVSAAVSLLSQLSVHGSQLLRVSLHHAPCTMLVLYMFFLLLPSSLQREVPGWRKRAQGTTEVPQVSSHYQVPQVEYDRGIWTRGLAGLPALSALAGTTNIFKLKNCK